MVQNFDGENIDKFLAICQYFPHQNFHFIVVSVLFAGCHSRWQSVKCHKNTTAPLVPSLDTIVILICITTKKQQGSFFCTFQPFALLSVCSFLVVMWF